MCHKQALVPLTGSNVSRAIFILSSRMPSYAKNPCKKIRDIIFPSRQPACSVLIVLFFSAERQKAQSNSVINSHWIMYQWPVYIYVTSTLPRLHGGPHLRVWPAHRLYQELHQELSQTGNQHQAVTNMAADTILNLSSCLHMDIVDVFYLDTVYCRIFTHYRYRRRH